MKNLPPLNAMKAFEVAARNGSFTSAADELGVSSAAVSQHVRNLETYFGKQLFVRNGNRITMTDAGHAIYPQTSRALAEIAAVAGRILEGEVRPRLVVSVPFSLAESWLVPRLAKLVDEKSDLAVDIRVEDDPIDLTRHTIDVRISYGDYHYPGVSVVRLVHDEVLPVCSQSFWNNHASSRPEFADFPQSAFIHTHWGPSYASHPTWSDWFNHAGINLRREPSLGRRVGLSSLAISVARSGLGIALGHRLLAQPDLEAGRLIALSSVALKLGHSYCAFLPNPNAKRKQMSTLLRLLQE